jgi:hypothetical protein
MGTIYPLAATPVAAEDRLPVGLAVGVALPTEAVDAASEDPAAFGRAY